MLIKQIIEFELRGAGTPSRACALQLIISMAKQTSQSKIFESISISCLNIVGGNVSYFPYLGQINYKILPRNTRFY